MWWIGKSVSNAHPAIAFWVLLKSVHWLIRYFLNRHKTHTKEQKIRNKNKNKKILKLRKCRKYLCHPCLKLSLVKQKQRLTVQEIRKQTEDCSATNDQCLCIFACVCVVRLDTFFIYQWNLCWGCDDNSDVTGAGAVLRATQVTSLMLT